MIFSLPGILRRVGLVYLPDLFHNLFCWFAVGGNGRRQYENSLDGTALGVLAGKQIAEKRNVFEYGDASYHGELW